MFRRLPAVIIPFWPVTIPYASSGPAGPVYMGGPPLRGFGAEKIMREVYRVPLGYKVAPMLANKARVSFLKTCVSAFSRSISHQSLCIYPPGAMLSLMLFISAIRHSKAASDSTSVCGSGCAKAIFVIVLSP